MGERGGVQRGGGEGVGCREEGETPGRGVWTAVTVATVLVTRVIVATCYSLTN